MRFTTIFTLFALSVLLALPATACDFGFVRRTRTVERYSLAPRPVARVETRTYYQAPSAYAERVEYSEYRSSQVRRNRRGGLLSGFGRALFGRSR